MEEHPDQRLWHPKPFSIAVLESDEYLADTLCDRLRSSAMYASAYYDIGALIQAHRTTRFDAYVLDYLADWASHSGLLEKLVASIRSNTNSSAPIFILGNQTVPERIEGLASILFLYKVRYILKPIKTDYLARRIVEAIAKNAGI